MPPYGSSAPTWHSDDLEAAFETLREAGDRSGQARVAGWIGNAMAGARRRDEAVAYLAPMVREFDDLSDDDPNLVHLVQAYASASFLTGHYREALESADRVLAAAERMGDARQASEALRIKGSSAFNLGRLWEAQALLLGAGRVAREAGLPDAELRSTVILASVIALDSPAGALALGREAIELARRLGQRSQEIVLSQNAAEDARRVGEWDWAAEVVAHIDQFDIDAAAHLANRIQQSLSAAWRGALKPEDLDALRIAVTTVEDRDIESSIFDLEGVLHTTSGRFIEAATAWMKVASASDLNAPYALPRAGRAAVLGGDAALAHQALDRLAALGSRGRAIDADKAAIGAGLAALAGDRAAALAGYRTAVTAYRELGLAFDEALLGIEAARMVGVAEPEVLAWVETARATLTRLGAESLLGVLEGAAARGAIGAEAAAGA